jgi:adenosine 3'-phospho 5'-phosphosulfate transporter B3
MSKKRMTSATTGSSLRLAQLALGVLVFHLLNSVLQEAVFRLPGFDYTVLLSFLQASCIAIIAFAEFQRAKLVRRAPLRTYFFLSVLSAGSVMLTNQASHLLNYPTQVIFKSSKLLFVMTLRFFLIKPKHHRNHHCHSHRAQPVTVTEKSAPGESAGNVAPQLEAPGAAHRQLHHHHHHHSPAASRMSALLKNHQFIEVVASLMIVCGLVFFTYATASGKHSSSVSDRSNWDFMVGLGAIVTALLFDAMLYIGEEKYCFSAHQSTNTEVILFTYSFASLNSFGALVVSGNAASSLSYLAGQPMFGGLVVLFSAANFFGTHFLLLIVSEYNSNSAVMVTSVRKMFTVILSFLLYPNNFQFSHLQGMILVSVGIYMHETSRSKSKKEEALLAAEVIEGGENIV